MRVINPYFLFHQLLLAQFIQSPIHSHFAKQEMEHSFYVYAQIICVLYVSNVTIHIRRYSFRHSIQKRRRKKNEIIKTECYHSIRAEIVTVLISFLTFTSIVAILNYSVTRGITVGKKKNSIAAIVRK